MSLISPAALGLLGLIPVVFLIYMLRRRRPRVRVSSTLLWQQLVYEAEGKFSWHPPLRELLLALQILFVAALIMALGRPALLGPPPKQIVIVLHASASMQATDVFPNRLQEAKRQAEELIDGLGPADRVTLIRAATVPQVLARSVDRIGARRAVAGLSGGASSVNMRDSLAVASALASEDKADTVYVISDGQVGDLSTLPPFPAHLKLIPVGADGSNQAITAVSVRRSLVAPFNFDAFVRVTNYAQDSADLPLVVAVDGQPVDRRDLQVPPLSSSEMVIRLPAGAQVLQLSLIDTQGAVSRTDVLALDDRARVDLPAERPLRVRLVSADPEALLQVLSHLPQVEVETVDPSAYAPSNSADLTVFDSYIPADLPRGNLLLVNPQSDGGLLDVRGEIDLPAISGYDLGSPLLAAVDLAGLTVPKATRMGLPTWANEVVGADMGPLVFEGVQGGRRIVVFAFSPSQTNLPFRVSFPILMANTVAWLAPMPLQSTVKAEESILIHPISGTTSITVEKPDGSLTELRTEGQPVAFADTNLIGGYRVVYHGPDGDLGADSFSVNVVDENESRVAPRPYLDSVVEAPSPAGAAQPTGMSEIWQWLASLALVLSLLEWWLYNRQGAAAAGLAEAGARKRVPRLRGG